MPKKSSEYDPGVLFPLLYGVWLGGHWKAWLKDGNGIVFYSPYLSIARAMQIDWNNNSGPSARVCTFGNDGNPVELET